LSGGNVVTRGSLLPGFINYASLNLSGEALRPVVMEDEITGDLRARMICNLIRFIFVTMIILVREHKKLQRCFKCLKSNLAGVAKIERHN